MVKEIYSLGGYNFYSAKELAEFKTNFPSDWEVVKDMPLRLSGLSMPYYEFVDYIDSLQTLPDICLAYMPDRARGYGFYTTIWCNSLRINDIAYLNSNNLKDDIIFEMIAMSKWRNMKIRTKYCR